MPCHAGVHLNASLVQEAASGWISVYWYQNSCWDLSKPKAIAT